MKRNKFWTAVSRTVAAGTITLVVALILAPCTWAQSTYKTLYRFKGGMDGGYPEAGLIFDAAGNLYGTTRVSGHFGVVFKLTPNPDGSWSESVVHRFTSKDGAFPTAGLIFDQAGNLYGTTQVGGASGWGTVFKLTPNQDGSWTESLPLSVKCCRKGIHPTAGLVFDQVGNLYGTMSEGGIGCNGSGCGVVFKLTPHPDGSWTESIVHQFTGGKDGGTPLAGLIFDKAGNLYGTTVIGGHSRPCGGLGCGVVFELTPTPDGSWSENVLHQFSGWRDGGHPLAALILDQAGNLYGTAQVAGDHGWGTAFWLGDPWHEGHMFEVVLDDFKGGKYGAYPQASLISDQAGNLYGTTYSGGNLACDHGNGCGVVFKLLGGGCQKKTVHRFSGLDGAHPKAGLIVDHAGNLYGTTYDGGKGYGVVFEITP